MHSISLKRRRAQLQFVWGTRGRGIGARQYRTSVEVCAAADRYFESARFPGSHSFPGRGHYIFAIIDRSPSIAISLVSVRTMRGLDS